MGDPVKMNRDPLRTTNEKAGKTLTTGLRFVVEPGGLIAVCRLST